MSDKTQVLQASAHVTSTNIALAKANHMRRPAASEREGIAKSQRHKVERQGTGKDRGIAATSHGLYELSAMQTNVR